MSFRRESVISMGKTTKALLSVIQEYFGFFFGGGSVKGQVIVRQTLEYSH